MSHADELRSALRGVVLGALVWLAPAAVRAQDAVELTWDAPANCPQADAVRARVRELAGQVLQNAERLRADGRIVRVAGRYRLTLTVRDRGEARERTMESQSCVDLAGAAAVALGLLLRRGAEPPAGAQGSEWQGSAPPPLRPGDTAQPAPGTSATTASRPQTPESRPARPAAVAPAVTPTKREPSSDDEEDDPPEEDPEAASAEEEPEYTEDEGWTSDASSLGERGFGFFLRAPLGVLDAGPLPKPSFGLGGALGVRYAGWRFAAGARLLAEQSWPMPGTAGVAAAVERWQTELSVCKGFRAARFELAPCLTLGLDFVAARGTGPNVSSQSQRSVSFVPGAGGALHFYVLDSMAIFGAIGVGLETSRPQLLIGGLGPVGQVGPVQLSAAIGPEWIF